MKDKMIKTGYNEVGPYLQINMQLNWDSLETFELPKSCAHCPVGFSDYDCGRNFPYQNQDYERRPDTCRLKLLKIKDIL